MGALRPGASYSGLQGQHRRLKPARWVSLEGFDHKQSWWLEAACRVTGKRGLDCRAGDFTVNGSCSFIYAYWFHIAADDSRHPFRHPTPAIAPKRKRWGSICHQVCSAIEDGLSVSIAYTYRRQLSGSEKGSCLGLHCGCSGQLTSDQLTLDRGRHANRQYLQSRRNSE